MRVKALVFSVIITMLILASPIITASAETTSSELVKEFEAKDKVFYAGVSSFGERYIAVPNGFYGYAYSKGDNKMYTDFYLRIFGEWDTWSENWDETLHTGVLVIDRDTAQGKFYNVTNITFSELEDYDPNTMFFIIMDTVVAYDGIFVVGFLDTDPCGIRYSDDHEYMVVFKMDYDGNILWARVLESSANEEMSGDFCVPYAANARMVALEDGRIAILWVPYGYDRLIIATLDAYNGALVNAYYYDFTSDVFMTIVYDERFSADVYGDKLATLHWVSKQDYNECESLWIINTTTYEVEKIFEIKFPTQTIAEKYSYIKIREDKVLVMYYYWSNIGERTDILYIDYDDERVLWHKSFVMPTEYTSSWSVSASSEIIQRQKFLFMPTVGEILDNGSVILGGMFGKLVTYDETYMEYMYPAIVLINETGSIVTLRYHPYLMVDHMPIGSIVYDGRLLEVTPIGIDINGDNLTLMTSIYETRYNPDSGFFNSKLGVVAMANVNLTYGNELSQLAITDFLEYFDHPPEEAITGVYNSSHINKIDLILDGISEYVSNETILTYPISIELSEVETEERIVYQHAISLAPEEVTEEEEELPWWLAPIVVSIAVIGTLTVINTLKDTVEEVRDKTRRFIKKK